MARSNDLDDALRDDGGMGERVVVVAYDDAWPVMFAEVGARLRRELGDTALRIDHIGSTSVPGLDAKPIVDIQISVASFEPVDAFRLPIERAGFVYRPDNPERTKRYFRERPGERRTHIHVRRAGSFSEQFALLFRDFLRAHADHAQKYAELKHRLAKEFSAPDQRHDYVEAKTPFIWHTIHLADDWAQSTGWEPPPSDC
jgi:GrpB-like predicted nucleotidyltransferase (UPF0157 family)